MVINNIKKEMQCIFMCLCFASCVVYQTLLQCWWMALWWRLKNEVLSKLAIWSILVVVGHLNSNGRSFDPGQTACAFLSCAVSVMALQWAHTSVNHVKGFKCTNLEIALREEGLVCLRVVLITLAKIVVSVAKPKYLQSNIVTDRNSSYSYWLRAI